MGQVLAIVSSKGGVGKTTTAVNLAAAFASLDFPTLLVEADPQCSLVSNFGFDRYDIPKGLSDVARGDVRLEETTFETPVAGLHVVSSNIWSQEEEIEYLKHLEQDPLLLRRAVQVLKESYDYIVIDSPPMLGPITLAVLASADRYIVPMQTEPHALRSLNRLMAAASLVRSEYNADLAFDGVALTMVDSRTRMSAQIGDLVKAACPDQVFSATIPRSVRLAEVPAAGRPLAVSAPSSRAGRAYTSLAEEILLVHARQRAIQRSEDLVDVDESALNESDEMEASADEEAMALALLRERNPGRSDAPSETRGPRASVVETVSAKDIDWDERFVDVESLIEVEASPAITGAAENGADWEND